MNRILSCFRPFVLFAAALLLLSCESRQELQDRMESISGEYRLASLVLSDRTDYVNVIPHAEYDAASARIFQDGDGWIVEYTVPFVIQVMPLQVTLHRIRQRILWDRQLTASQDDPRHGQPDP